MTPSARAVRPDVIVVGASAGGVQALQQLVAGLPRDLPAAILIVLHIPSISESLLDEVLARAGAMCVTPAMNGEPIAPGHIYVARNDRHMMVEHGHIRLTRAPKESRSRPAIDVLFRSAAVAYGPRVIGVVLTGALEDGSAGLWAVKDAGGIAIVQSPRDSAFPSMPESALAQVVVDYTVPVAEMPELLIRLTREQPETTARSGTLSKVAAGKAARAMRKTKH